MASSPLYLQWQTIHPPLSCDRRFQLLGLLETILYAWYILILRRQYMWAGSIWVSTTIKSLKLRKEGISACSASRGQEIRNPVLCSHYKRGPVHLKPMSRRALIWSRDKREPVCFLNRLYSYLCTEIHLARGEVLFGSILT